MERRQEGFRRAGEATELIPGAVRGIRTEHDVAVVAGADDGRGTGTDSAGRACR